MNKLPEVRFVFDRRKKASEKNQATIELEIYFNRTSRKFISSGVSLLSYQWDKEKRVINHEDSQKLNFKLAALKSKIEKLLVAMEVDGENISVENLNARLEEKTCPQNSFIDFMAEEIAGRKLEPSTRTTQHTALAALERFGKIKSFASLTPENIQKFDDFLRKEDTGRCQATLHNYHKRIKPYVTKAYKLRYIDKNPYDLFDDKRGRSKERKPLTLKELDILSKLDLSSRLERVRDLFLFCCFTGLAFADMQAFDFNKDVVESNGLKYIDGERVKTGSEFYAPILRPAMNVLEKYNYKLPRISMQKYNDYLHLLEDKMSLRKPLTSHIARYTFATTVTLANDIPIESVSKMLGHKNIQTTQIYAKVLKSSIERHAQTLNKLI